jgi:hypothetical protein
MITNNQKTDSVKTVLTISMGLIVLYLITKWDWTIPAALAISLAGIFSSYLSEKINLMWMKLSWLLNLITSNILLSTIFFLFLFPIALLSRLFGKNDPLNLKNKAGSNFKNSHKQLDKVSFKKTW